MERKERDVKEKLKPFKDASGSAFELLTSRLSTLPYEAVLMATDIGIAIASSNLRSAIEFLKAVPDTMRLLDMGDVRMWGETGKRLAATSADTAIEYFQVSAAILTALPAPVRPLIIRLVSKQSALSANTAIETFRSSPRIIGELQNPLLATKILNISIEIARHSVKHSSDLFLSAPETIMKLKGPDEADVEIIQQRALWLSQAFAVRSGGTAAEFFAEIPTLSSISDRQAIERLFSLTEEYLERSGGVALQYFKAASRVLNLAGRDSFERWSNLAKKVALQGNAASYHFMKASPQIIADLAAKLPLARRPLVVAAVLEIVEEIADENTVAAVECFKASGLALRSASLGQFRAWALRGIEKKDETPRRLQAYYALESKESQQSLFRVEGGLTLDSISQTLRLYVEGLTGRVLTVSSLSTIPDESRIGDGKTIFLPSVVAEFEEEAENFRLFKVLAAHAAGQIEFQTYARDTTAILAAFEEVRSAFKGVEIRGPASPPADSSASAPPGQPAKRRNRNTPGAAVAQDSVDFLRLLKEFPNRELAMRIFTTIENGRIDFLLRKTYRGIRRDLDFVRLRLGERRPRLAEIPQEVIPFELLFQIAICGEASLEARRAFPAMIMQIEGILSNFIFQDAATVGESILATRHIFDLFVLQPMKSESGEPSRDEPESGEAEGDQTSEDDSSDAPAQQKQSMEVQQDPFSYWSSPQTQEISTDEELLTHWKQQQGVEQDLEKGDRLFYYDEWDRELGDHRTNWCRVIERVGAKGSRSFVELTRSRFSGVISSIRYQFQLMRPENLRRIRGEVDGEEFDLQAVIDYALDRRSTGIVDERLYTRKLRRERDVAVSFLLDMSSSTARTISRVPNKPYTNPGQRIIDIEKEGLVLMSEALEAVGDTYAIQGFTSEGRRNVKFMVIKDFNENYSPEVERRIGGITYQNNTRLGAAIRHSITRLASQDARTRLLIVLSDGRPYDHDYGDSRYAREDTRMALRQARLEGITPFCITIDRESESQLKDMYGEVGYTIIDEVLSLPERLPGIYRRLTT